MTTKFKKYPPPILEAWAVWEILRKLGFKADDIFWVFEPTLNAVPRPGLTLGVKLVVGDNTLRVTCSQRLSEGEAKRLERQSRTFMEQVNKDAFDHEEMKDVLHQSYAWKNQLGLLTTLKAKGFEFPFRLN